MAVAEHHCELTSPRTIFELTSPQNFYELSLGIRPIAARHAVVTYMAIRPDPHDLVTLLLRLFYVLKTREQDLLAMGPAALRPQPQVVCLVVRAQAVHQVEP